MTDSIVTDIDNADLQSSKRFYARLLDYKRSLDEKVTHESDWYVIQSQGGSGFGVCRDNAQPADKISTDAPCPDD